MSVASFSKDPIATLDYSLDWGSWLLSGETIQSATWTITSDQIPVTGDATVSQSVVVGGVCSAWITAGNIGTVYTADCVIVTSGGRTDARSITLTIIQR